MSKPKEQYELHLVHGGTDWRLTVHATEEAARESYLQHKGHYKGLLKIVRVTEEDLEDRT